MDLVGQIVPFPFQNLIKMIDNAGKNALIFGVRNDLSLAWSVAQKLHQSGCQLTLAVASENVSEIQHLVSSQNMAAVVVSVDVRNDEQILEVVNVATRSQQSIDYLLHAVAYGDHNVMCSVVPGSKEEPSAYLDINFESLVDSFNISAFSLLRMVRIAKPFLSKGASILALSFDAARQIYPGYAGMSINKAALENIVMYLAYYLGKEEIRVNVISAGMVMTTSAGGIKGSRTLRKIAKNSAPLGNIKAEDVGNASLYYFSDLSKKVTANIHYVDGGINKMGIFDNEL